MKINGIYTVLVTVTGIILLDKIVRLFDRLPGFFGVPPPIGMYAWKIVYVLFYLFLLLFIIAVKKKVFANDLQEIAANTES